MCAVCFTGFQAIPVAAAAGRAWWVKRSVLWAAGHIVENNDEIEQPVAELEIEPAEEHLALA